jgi:hypothetical protein
VTEEGGKEGRRAFVVYFCLALPPSLTAWIRKQFELGREIQQRRQLDARCGKPVDDDNHAPDALLFECRREMTQLLGVLNLDRGRGSLSWVHK